MSNEYPPYGGSHSGDRNQADDGEPWPAYPAHPPPQQAVASRQVAPVVVAVVIVSVLVFCGLFGAFFFATAKIGDSIVEGQDFPALVTIEEGESFAIDGFEVEDGWHTGADADKKRRTTVLGLAAENTTDEPTTVEFDIGFYADMEELGRVMCFSDVVVPGETTDVTCDSVKTKRIDGYDALEVIGHYPW